MTDSKLPLIKTVSIQSVATGLLLIPIGVNEDGRKVGMSYNQVLTKVKQQFPDCGTTLKCLQWYNSKVKSDGKEVPIRPRFDPPLPE